MYMVLLFTFNHQMPGKHIIVGTEPIHFDAFNIALNTEIERWVFITRYCYRMTAKGDEVFQCLKKFE